MIERIVLVVSIDFEKFVSFLKRLQLKCDKESIQLKEYSPNEVIERDEEIFSSLKAGCRVVIWPVLRREDAKPVEDIILKLTRLRNMSGYVYVLAASRHLFDSTITRYIRIKEIPLSDEKERRKFIEAFMKHNNLPPPENLQELVNLTAGLTLYDMKMLFQESLKKHGKIISSEITEYKRRLLLNYGLEYIEPKFGFEVIGGYNYLKEYAKKMLVELIRNPDLVKYYGLNIPRGILLYGPPGTGKTTFAYALAKEVNLPVVKITPATIMYSSEVERRLDEVIKIIEALSPIIVFIDEFDQLSLRREIVSSTADAGLTRRIENMLLDWLGSPNRRSIVIGSTNYIEQIDPAFLRPGRIDEIIPVFLPDYHARKEIWEIHTKVKRKLPLASDIDFYELADLTYCFTGAEIEQCVVETAKKAMMRGLKEINMQMFRETIEFRKPSIADREKSFMEIVGSLSSLETEGKLMINREFIIEALAEYAMLERQITDNIDRYFSTFEASNPELVEKIKQEILRKRRERALTEAVE